MCDAVIDRSPRSSARMVEVGMDYVSSDGVHETAVYVVCWSVRENTLRKQKRWIFFMETPSCLVPRTQNERARMLGFVFATTLCMSEQIWEQILPELGER